MPFPGAREPPGLPNDPKPKRHFVPKTPGLLTKHGAILKKLTNNTRVVAAWRINKDQAMFQPHGIALVTVKQITTKPDKAATLS